MSELRAAVISDVAGTGPVTLTGQSAVKSWINFKGSGTVSIRDSFNVSSITDNGTGDYTINLTNSMSSINYAFQLTVETTTGFSATVGKNPDFSVTASALRVESAYWPNGTSNTIFDPEYITGAFHGDLA